VQLESVLGAETLLGPAKTGIRSLVVVAIVLPLCRREIIRRRRQKENLSKCSSSEARDDKAGGGCRKFHDRREREPEAGSLE